MPKYIIPIIYFTLIMIWGSTWIAIKVSIGETPFLMAAIRFFIAGVTLVLYQVIRKQTIFPPREDRRLIFTLGLGNFFFGYGLTYWGIQFVNSNVTSILWATLPVMIAIFAHRMLDNEKLSLSSVFSLLGSILGTLLIFDLQGTTFDPEAAIGMTVILVSILAAAYPNVLYKRDGKHLDPVSTNASAMLIGGVLLFFTGFLLEPWSTVDLTITAVGATLYLAIIGSAIGFTLYFWLIKHITIVKMSYTTFLIPIIASFWGWLLLDEGLSGSGLWGAIIIILSVSLPELVRTLKFNSKVE